MVAHTMTKGSSRGMTKTRAYGKMMIVAFGLAVIAVMVVHKLRERRILNLIVEDKDQQLISLHLLLQREMDLNKEMSKKIEDLKPRLKMLRSQKIELHGRVLELHSTVASLKDDIKVVESNLLIKNEENKMLRDKITEILKEKDDEIEQLKRINGEKIQKGIEVQSVEDQLLNSTNVMGKVVEVDLKRVEKSKGEETDSITRSHEDGDGQGKVGDVTKGGMKLEVPYESKHGPGVRGEGKRSTTSRTKGKKWRGIARNRRLGHTMKSGKVSGGTDDRSFAQSNGDLVHEKHDDEVHGTSLDNVNTNIIEKTIEMEGSQVNQTLTVQMEEPASDGRTGVNKVEENSTMEKVDYMNSIHESKMDDDQNELKLNVKNSDDLSSLKVEFTDVPDEMISSLENVTTISQLDSNTDDDAHGDLIVHKDIKDHNLQESEAEESGNDSGDSELDQQDQQDPISHLENYDDPQESEVEDGHTNQEEEEKDNEDGSQDSETDSARNTTEK